MGCGASTGEGAEPRRRRRGWSRARALGNSEASTRGLLAQRQQGQEAESSSAAGRRRGSKVAPEPKEHGGEAAGREAALPSTPGSPSFRYYCQKTAFVDRIVADADASSDGSVRSIAATACQASNRNDVTTTYAQESSEVPEHKTECKEGARWLRFRGLSMVTTAWHSLFSRHTSCKASPSPAAEPQPPPAAAAAVRSHL